MFKSTSTSKLLNIIFPINIIIVILIGYFTLDFNSLYQSFKGKSELITQNKNCDLHLSSCKITIQDGTTFELEILDKSIPLMKEITFLIKSNKSDLENLNLNIYASNMFMGDMNLPLENLGEGRYKAVGTLPTCNVGNMLWNAEIKIEKLSKNIGAQFQFKTDI